MLLMNERGLSSSFAIIIVIVIVSTVLLFSVWPEGQSFEQATGFENWSKYQELKARFTGNTENIRIDKWIVTNGLNKYGDPADTLYTGGTPLFNEHTGEQIDRYEYIKRQHPDEPWN